MKNIVSIIFLLSGMAFSGPLFSAWQQPELSHNLTKIRSPVKASQFELQNMDEEKIKLSDYSGKVVMINFWATWCPPCIREMPSMERLYKKLEGEKFIVLAVNQMEDEDDVFAFTGQLETDPTFPILFDKESDVSRKYGVRGLPTTYLVDKKGYLRYRAVGGRLFDHESVMKIIKKLIAE